ncbi:hypothetical protein [Lacipirellula sp.]|uniref:hypothetical protein n=1 Tax=Lacipirellula sp. TaxID=2691419 RepID=UPI003D129C07
MCIKLNRKSCKLAAALSAVLAAGAAVPAQAEVVAPNLRDNLIFMPPHVAGDAEFDGNGPAVNVKVKFTVSDNTLLYSVYYKAKETKSDWTEASGWSPSRTVYTAPPGMRIVSVPKSEYELVIDTMSGHNSKTYPTALGRVTLYGDTKGKDAGVYTKLELNLDASIPLNVEMNGPRPEQEAYLPRTYTYTPPPTRGDKDFDGNGPRVVVDASVEHDGKAVYFVIKMIAEETKPDNTTAVGETRSLMYTAPAGRRITSLGGQTSWPNLVSYYDTNHNVDKFDTPLGPVSVFGDHKGDDASDYTRVVFGNVDKFVVVRTAPSGSLADGGDEGGGESASLARSGGKNGNAKNGNSGKQRNFKRRK